MVKKKHINDGMVKLVTMFGLAPTQLFYQMHLLSEYVVIAASSVVTKNIQRWLQHLCWNTSLKNKDNKSRYGGLEMSLFKGKKHS